MSTLPPSNTRRGFTLFEVGISLVIVSVGVLSVMMLMPAGLKAQQMARFQILASAKAIELMSVNANQWRKWDEQRLEGQTLGLCSINQIAQSPLIEQKNCNYRHGSLPVPPDIAQRLDSDNDEIAQVLRNGGYLFYSSPRPVASIDEGVIQLEDIEIPNESQRLVFAYVGPAQQPALANHPCKAWPYYDWYPAPPRITPYPDNSTPSSRHEDSWRLNAWPNLTEFLAVKTAWLEAQATPPTPPDPPPPAPPLTPAQKDQIVREEKKKLVETYRDKAKELVQFLGMPVLGGTNMGIPDKPPGNAFTPVKPYEVLAAQYVAQSMVWITSPQLIPPTPDESTQARTAHEASLTWLHRHVTTDPYDWGIDRALNFQNGWDHPLLQYELFPSTDPDAKWIDANIFTAANSDVSWRILSARPVRNAGTSTSYGVRSVVAPVPGPVSPPRPSGNKLDIEESWGTQDVGQPDTFNLTAPFQPAHRCRQLVFWAVDWKSYQDAETAPSAPQDASRVPYDSDGKMSYHNNAHKFNNPEVFFTWTNSSRTSLNSSAPDGLSSKGNYLGIWGADRNGNRKLDQGNVPPSVRMRAVSVARFNIYNPRVWSGLRN